MAEIIPADDPQAADRAVEVLRSGQLVVAPTDTVYTVIADAFQTDATQRLLGAKRRGREVPLSILIRNPRQVIGLAGDVPETAERLMASYWPGPVALVLPEQPEMPWDLGATRGALTLRMPADDLVLAIAAEIGPLACSAANRRGELVPTTVEEAELQMGDAIALYVDGGSGASVLTTIVDCTRGGAEVLREGIVSSDDVQRVADGEVGWGQQPAHTDRLPVEEVPGPADEPAAMAVDPHAPSHEDDEHNEETT